MQQLLTQEHTKPLEDLFQLATTFEAAEHETIQCSAEANASGNQSDTLVSVVRNSHPHKSSQTKLFARKQQNNLKEPTNAGCKMC